MTKPLTVWKLFNTYQSRFGLRWIAGQAGKNHALEKATESEPYGESTLIGHMNCVHPNRIQVIGVTEINYLKQLGKNSYHDLIVQLFHHAPSAIIVTDGQGIPEMLIQNAETTNTPLLSSDVSDQELINHILYYLNKSLAEDIILHGVFLEVVGIGVLLTGENGIGKSELALELLSRGHRLIADDAPEFSCVAPNTVNGCCPPALKDFLEVRGLGVLNIRAMFGDSAIKQNKNLRLIVQLKQMSELKPDQINRLEGNREIQEVLSVRIPKVTLPVAPGRNLAVIVECAARNQILLDKGYNSAESFITQQRKIMEHLTP